jgi:hypothetical protein
MGKKKSDAPLCFRVPGGMVHKVLFVEGEDERFPLGRAQCAPFARRETDETLYPNQTTVDEFCKRCL